jgi:ferredoxin-NADP reductase
MAAANPRLRIEHILAGPNLPPDWKGKTGFINKDVVAELVADYRERLFYLSGPPRMVIALEGQLTALDIPREQMKQDSFTGYD